ncbi:MAG: hypothetical protein ACRYF3_03400 [Janthinobacterium lividum]
MPRAEDPTALGERAMRELKQPFTTWLTDHVQIDEEVGAETIVEVLTVSVGGLISLRPRPDATVTRFAPDEIESLVQQVIPLQVADAGAPDAAEMEQDFQSVWFQFFAFLGETGRWTGSQGDLETCLALLEIDPPDLVDALAAAAQDVDADEEDATLLTSFPVRAAAAVLAHVGEGLDVPDDEEIAADDVTAILAGFEHRIPITADDDGEPQHLEDVPWLHQVVLAMIDLELIETDEAETLLTATDAAADWLSPTPEPRELRRALVGQFVLDDPATLLGGFSVAEAMLPSVFAAAMTGHPLDEPALTEVLQTAGELGPAVEVAVDEVRARLADLAVFGIVSERAPWTVARGYWPAIAAAVAEGADDLDDTLGGVEGFGGLEEPHWLESVAGQLGIQDEQMNQIRGILGGR